MVIGVRLSALLLTGRLWSGGDAKKIMAGQGDEPLPAMIFLVIVEFL